MEKVIVLATSFQDELLSHPREEGQAVQMLADLAAASNGGLEVVYRCDRDPRKPLTTAGIGSRTTAIIADLEMYPRELLVKIGAGVGGPLKLIARYGVGFDTVDLPAATEYGVIVTNCPGCNSRPTAELTVMTLLDVAGRRMPHYETASRGRTKTGPSRLDVTGKTLGIIGTGAIGKTVFALLGGYNIKAVAYDPLPDRQWAADSAVTYLDSPEAVCRQADFITLHPATDDTVITAAHLELMRPTTVLINCARRHHVDNEAAYHAVREGRIWGYGTDEIWDFDLPLAGLNIVVSPHVGSDTDMGKIGMQCMSAEAVVDYCSHRRPRHVLNPEVLKLAICDHLTP